MGNMNFFTAQPSIFPSILMEELVHRKHSHVAQMATTGYLKKPPTFGDIKTPKAAFVVPEEGGFGFRHLSQRSKCHVGAENLWPSTPLEEFE